MYEAYFEEIPLSIHPISFCCMQCLLSAHSHGRAVLH